MSLCIYMQEAARRMQGAARLLEVEGRGSRLASLQRQLVSRRCRLAVSYGAVYSVGPKTGSSLHLHASRLAGQIRARQRGILQPAMMQAKCGSGLLVECAQG